MASVPIPGFVRAGAVVRLVQLQKRADLNGRYAVVLLPLPPPSAAARIRVSLLFGNGDENVKVRPTNLAAVVEQSEDEAVRKRAGAMLATLLDHVIGLRWAHSSNCTPEEIAALEETGRHLRVLCGSGRSSTDTSPIACAFPGCSTVAALFKKCAGCKSVRYCSRKHQKADWKRHKPMCTALKRAKVRCVPVLPEEHEEKPPAGTVCPICMCSADEGLTAPYPVLAGCGCDRSGTTRYHIDCLLHGAATAAASGRKSMYDAFCLCSVCQLPFSGPVERTMRSAASTAFDSFAQAATDAWWLPLLTNPDVNPDVYGAQMVRVFAPLDRNQTRAATMLQEAWDWMIEREFTVDASVAIKNETLRLWMAWIETHSSLESSPTAGVRRFRREVVNYIEQFTEADPNMELLPEFHRTLMRVDFNLAHHGDGLAAGLAGVALFERLKRTDEARRLQRELGLLVFHIVDHLRFDGADDYGAWIARSRARPDDLPLAAITLHLPEAVTCIEAAADHYKKTYHADTHPDLVEIMGCYSKHVRLICSIKAAPRK